MRLHEDTIEAVKERADIHDIVSEHVVLKKQGRDFVGLCPFHEEKSPSFSVSTSKQIYNCIGCGKGGHAITFMKEIGQQSFAEVVLDLAKRYNVPVKTLEPEKQQEFQRQQSRREQLHEIMAVAVNFYEYALRQSQGKAALNYLLESRQFDDATLKRFQIGYAPASWDALYGYLVDRKHFPVEMVEAAGLILPRKSGDGYYDRFRDRVMIPIYDDRGRAIAFGGRALGDEKPKYLNSPETELFDKGKNLFCLDKAKSAISKDDRAVVVEGYFDAIALHTAGIETAVASLGTALSERQVRQLLRYTESKQVVFNFDADAAGIKATNRAIGEVADLAYRGGVQLRILNIPEGKDADDFLKSASPEAYVALLDNAPLWIDWQIDRTTEECDITQADGYQYATTAFVDLLRRIENLATRSYYINRCAEVLARGDARRVPTIAEVLMTQTRRARLIEVSPSGKLTAQKERVAEQPQTSSNTARTLAEEILLKFYIHCRELRDVTINIVQYLDSLSLEGESSIVQNLALLEASHRDLWRHMMQATKDCRDRNLIAWIQEEFSDEQEILSKWNHLIYLSELAAQDIQVERGTLVLRAATAVIEESIRQTRYQNFLKVFQEIDFIKDREDAYIRQYSLMLEKSQISSLEALRREVYLPPSKLLTDSQRMGQSAIGRAYKMQAEIYQENVRLNAMHQQRLTTVTDLVSSTWIGIRESLEKNMLEANSSVA